MSLQVLKFGATWCGPCIKMKPTISTLITEFPEVEFSDIDIDDQPELAVQYKIKSVPTLIFLKNGVEINKIIGLQPIDPLRKLIREYSSPSI